MEKIIHEGTWTVSERTELSALTIAPGAAVTAPKGSTLIMTVDGTVTQPRPGTYRGTIVLEVLKSVTKISKFKNNYKTVVYADKHGISGEKSALSGIKGGTVEAHRIADAEIAICADGYNGISVNDGDMRIENTKISVEGRGADDFEVFGTALATGNHAKVVLDHVDIRTHGCISSGIIAAGNSNVLVKDSAIDCKGDTNQGFHTKFPHLTEVPWVLGLRGTLRSTNLLDQANVIYYNSKLRSNGWGVLSVDFCEKAHHTIINTDAVIEKDSKYGSGYAAYILGDTTSTFLGVHFDVPDYPMAAGGSTGHIVVGPSSRALLEQYSDTLGQLKAELGGDFSSVEERPSVIRGGRFGGMWHHKASGTWDFLPGTVVEAGETAFMIKSDDRINNPTIHCDGVSVKAPRIVHLMQSDDAGMGNRMHDPSWAPVSAIIAYYKKEKCKLADAENPENAVCTFRNMTLEGDFFNTRWKPQNLVLEFDGTSVTGVISSGKATHRHVSFYYALDKDGNRICVDESGRKYVTVEDHDILFGKMPLTYTVPLTYETGEFIRDKSDETKYKKIGYGIYFTHPEYLGDVDITPSRAVNNGVLVTLKNGSAWTVPDTCFLTALTLSEDSSILPPVDKTLEMTVNGKPVEIAPGYYKGNIKLTVS